MKGKSTHEKSGSVTCPYCGHQIARMVAYKGQKMHCQNCTSAVYAPRCVGGSKQDDDGAGCAFIFLFVFAVGIGITCFGFGFDFLDTISSYWTWGLCIAGLIVSFLLGYSTD